MWICKLDRLYTRYTESGILRGGGGGGGGGGKRSFHKWSLLCVVQNPYSCFMHTQLFLVVKILWFRCPVFQLARHLLQIFVKCLDLCIIIGLILSSCWLVIPQMVTVVCFAESLFMLHAYTIISGGEDTLIPLPCFPTNQTSATDICEMFGFMYNHWLNFEFMLIIKI